MALEKVAWRHGIFWDKTVPCRGQFFW